MVETAINKVEVPEASSKTSMQAINYHRPLLLCQSTAFRRPPPRNVLYALLQFPKHNSFNHSICLVRTAQTNKYIIINCSFNYYETPYMNEVSARVCAEAECRNMAIGDCNSAKPVHGEIEFLHKYQHVERRYHYVARHTRSIYTRETPEGGWQRESARDPIADKT